MGWGKRDRNDGWYDADVGAGENVPGLGETLVIASQLERVFGAAPDEDLKGAATRVLRDYPDTERAGIASEYLRLAEVTPASRAVSALRALATRCASVDTP